MCCMLDCRQCAMVCSRDGPLCRDCRSMPRGSALPRMLTDDDTSEDADESESESSGSSVQFTDSGAAVVAAYGRRRGRSRERRRRRAVNPNDRLSRLRQQGRDGLNRCQCCRALIFGPDCDRCHKQRRSGVRLDETSQKKGKKGDTDFQCANCGGRGPTGDRLG